MGGPLRERLWRQKPGKITKRRQKCRRGRLDHGIDALVNSRIRLSMHLRHTSSIAATRSRTPTPHLSRIRLNTVHLCSASVGQTIGLRRLPAPRVADHKTRWSAPPKVNSIEAYPG